MVEMSFVSRVNYGAGAELAWKLRVRETRLSGQRLKRGTRVSPNGIDDLRKPDVYPIITMRSD